MKQRSQARATTKKDVILFLAANRHDTEPRALDHEARAIYLELESSGYGDRFEFVTRWAAERLDLLRELRKLKPTILHFSGPVVTPEAFAQTLKAIGPSVRLVVLNACYTASIAKALLARVDSVDCVVGMSAAICDDAARTFAIGFYGGLGEHESNRAAFNQGKAAILLAGLPGADLVHLLVRDDACPYPGMRPFAAEDADRFHGREAEITDLIGWLRAGQREIFVVGPSGSGKSSLVAAGVLPRLARGLTGLGPFIVRELRPGDQPLLRLCQALGAPPGQPLTAAGRVANLLAHHEPTALVLIVVDQFEELFTQASAEERAAFLDALRGLRIEPRCALIYTLRADFSGALMESALWPERPAQLPRVDVIPLRGEALREAITAPAKEVGVIVEPGLTERLVADAASEPGILPLLQEALVQLWDARTDQTLTLAAYEALGDRVRSGLAVALARRADATLQRFSEAQTDITRRILLRLISFGEGRSDTRRQQPRAQLCAAGEDAVDFAFVLQKMVGHCLLTVDEDVAGQPRVDLAHEIMISAWPKLADWIRSHRRDEQRRRQLEAAAAEWVERGRGMGGLLDPIRLEEAEAWQRTESARQLGHSTDLEAFIAASRVEHDRRVKEALDQRTRLEESERRSRQLLAQMYAESGRQLFVDGRPQEAIAYLLAAREGGLDDPPLRMVFEAAKRHLPVIPALEHQGWVRSAAFSRDGTRVVTASADQTAQVWDAATGKRIAGSLEHLDRVVSAAFSPDGARVVTASEDKTARVWNAATGKPLTGPLEHRDRVMSAMFSPDGAHVVTASEDKTARVWDATTGKPLTGPLEHQDRVVSAAFSPDGTRVVTASADQTARVWDAATGEPRTGSLEHQGWVWSAAFSPDGMRVVTASEDRTARVWDAVAGGPLTSPLEHLGAVESATFSPDGTRVVTASDDQTAQVWDAVTGKRLIGPLAHQAKVWSAAFSPDDTRVVTASDDQTARVWDAATGQPLTGPLAHQGWVGSAVFSPDGTRVITTSLDHMARVWAAATDQLLLRPLEHAHTVWSAVFSPDGTHVVTASWDQTARVWDAATGKARTDPLAHQDQVVSAAFDCDGKRIVTASWDKTARVWDAETGKALTDPLPHDSRVVSAAFSPDGTRVVTASHDRTARVWDAATGRPLTEPLAHDSRVASAAFSPDGKRVVTASWDQTAQIWDAATGQRFIGPFAHQGWVVCAAFSPDGKRVVTSSDDQTAQVWDAADGRLVARLLEHRATVCSAAFSPDGKRVVTASHDKTARVWDAASGQPLTGPLEHRGWVWSAAFSPDGTRVVTASYDKTARVWDAATGKPLTQPLTHQDCVGSAAFDRDGMRVVTASWDRTARVWDVGFDTGTLEEWRTTAGRSPFALSGAALVRRSRSGSADG